MVVVWWQEELVCKQGTRTRCGGGETKTMVFFVLGVCGIVRVVLFFAFRAVPEDGRQENRVLRILCDRQFFRTHFGTAKPVRLVGGGKFANSRIFFLCDSVRLVLEASVWRVRVHEQTCGSFVFSGEW